MEDQNFSLKDFQAWLSNYNQNKKNQQDFGIRNIPGRIFRKTIDLSTAGVLQNTGIPFDGLQVEKIYDTATGLSTNGNIKIIFDRAMSDSQFNYKVLKENDSFTSGTSISRAYFSWDAQAGVSIDIVFFNDIDYRSGSQKTSIVGTVPVANTSPTAFYNKSVIPSSIQFIYQATIGTSSYVVPAGKYARVTFQGSLYGTGNAYGFINTGRVFTMYQTGSTPFASTEGPLIALAGQSIDCQLTVASGVLTAHIEVYDII